MSSSKLALPLLLAATLLSGCISSKRMTDISPLSDASSQRLTEDRTNAWPLYYSTGAGVSLLWPFFDFDDNGWAFRPFYVRDGDEHSVLWPLSGWDPKGGWALNAYWNRDSYGLFPLFHKSGSTSYLPSYFFPVWRYGDNWGILLLGGKGNDNWRLLNLYYRNASGYFHKGAVCSYSHWNFWPFLLRKSYTAKGENEPYQIDWRLFYGLLGGYQTETNETCSWILPFYLYESNKSTDQSMLFTLPFDYGVQPDSWRFLNFYYRNSPNYTHWNFWPILSRQSFKNPGESKTYNVDWRLLYGLLGGIGQETDSQKSWLVPLFYHNRNDTEQTQFTWAFPTFFAQKNPEVAWHTLPPFYYARTSEKHKLLVTPLGGIASNNDGMSFRSLLGPIYIDYKNPNEDYEFSSVLWPLYMRSRDGKAQWSYSFPFGYRWKKENEERRNFLFGLGGIRTLDNKTSWTIWPFYSTRNDFENSNFRYSATLCGNTQNADGTQSAHWLFPFYSHTALPNRETHSGFFFELGAIRTLDEKTSWAFWPFYSSRNDFKTDDFRYFLTLSGSNEDSSTLERSKWFFPFYHHKTLTNGETRNNFLLGLGTTRTHNDKTSWAIWPFYSSRNDFTNDADPRYFFTLLGSKENSASTAKDSNWFFPLYHYSANENDKGIYDFYALCYLFGIENSYSYKGGTKYDRHARNRFLPFYSYDSWTKCDENGLPTASVPYRNDFFIPFVYGFKNHTDGKTYEKSSSEHWALLKLLKFEDKTYGVIPGLKDVGVQALDCYSYDRIINTFRETRLFRIWKDNSLNRREQHIVWRAKAYCYDNYSGLSRALEFAEKANDSLHEIDPDLYKAIEEEIKNEPVEGDYEKKAEAFFRRELTKILRAKGIEIADNADKDAMTRAVQQLVAENTEILTEKEFQFWPFYESQEASDGNFEKELLWGVWYSRGNEEKSATSCLKYLYRRETTAEGTKLDVFPFISVDTGKRGSFSFLGKFFRIVNDDEKGWSGNFLFIPWGN